MQSTRRFITGFLISSCLVLAALIGFRLAAQPVRDWSRLRGFTPSPQVAKLGTDTTMTDKATRLFYINHPEVLGREAFNSACSDRGERTIVLGCYHSPENGIFIFDVSEPELAGVQQVTAAHEMLHMAYDRLSSDERARVDTLLLDYYHNQLKDERILKVIESYKTSEPNALTNEMHSIFGTEVANLPAELETYYQQYFTKRANVVAFAAQYQQAFTRREDTIAAYDAQLATLEAQITANQAALSQQAETLRVDRPRVEASNDQETIDGYNQRVTAYNALINKTNILVDQYNQIVEARNKIASEETQLQKSLDSTVSPE